MLNQSELQQAKDLAEKLGLDYSSLIRMALVRLHANTYDNSTQAAN
ncbi:hypothetical protein [Crinalium epipsammum]|nr:hypothetical protein [Crinalium epipsammum]